MGRYSFTPRNEAVKALDARAARSKRKLHVRRKPHEKVFERQARAAQKEEQKTYEEVVGWMKGQKPFELYIKIECQVCKRTVSWKTVSYRFRRVIPTFTLHEEQHTDRDCKSKIEVDLG